MSLGLNKNWGGEFKKYKMFESSLSMLDAGMDENIESKIQALEELRLNLEKNWDFSAIITEQSQLNHKNVSTTQRYAEISSTRQKEASNILDNLI